MATGMRKPRKLGSPLSLMSLCVVTISGIVCQYLGSPVYNRRQWNATNFDPILCFTSLILNAIWVEGTVSIPLTHRTSIAFDIAFGIAFVHRQSKSGSMSRHWPSQSLLLLTFTDFNLRFYDFNEYYIHTNVYG